MSQHRIQIGERCSSVAVKREHLLEIEIKIDQIDETDNELADLPFLVLDAHSTAKMVNINPISHISKRSPLFTPL